MNRNYQKGLQKIVLTLAVNEWEIELSLLEDRCLFGKGWCQFVKDADLSSGDVIAMHIMDEPYIVNVCIFNKEDLTFDKEAGSILSNQRAM